MGQRLNCLAPEKQSAEPPPSMGGHDDQIAVLLLCCFDYRLSWAHQLNVDGFRRNADLLGCSLGLSEPNSPIA
jgi:hypothetical protein